MDFDTLEILCKYLNVGVGDLIEVLPDDEDQFE
jgi:DNA-binding Xre family transcriptional regulator